LSRTHGINIELIYHNPKLTLRENSRKVLNFFVQRTLQTREDRMSNPENVEPQPNQPQQNQNQVVGNEPQPNQTQDQNQRGGKKGGKQKQPQNQNQTQNQNQRGGKKGGKKQTNQSEANTNIPPKEEELGPNQYFDMRKDFVLNFEKNYGMNPYPHKFEVSISVPEFHKKYGHLVEQQQLEDVVESVAGRVRLTRSYGKKLIFIDIFQDGEKLQVLGNLQFYDDKELFSKFLNIIHLGDFIGDNGFPCRSKTGELSIIHRTIQILSPCLHMLS